MKSFYYLFLFWGFGNLLQAQSVNSSLNFLKCAPQNTFTTQFDLLQGKYHFKKTQDNISKDGFFIDGLLSLGIALSDYNFSSNDPIPNILVVYSDDLVSDNSIRIGNKWYWGNQSKVKSGIQVVWIRLGQITPIERIQGAFFPITYRIAPLNIGSTNLIQLDQKKALELNLNIGLNSNIAYRDPNLIDPNALTLLQFGLLVNPSIKLSIQRFCIGIDLQYIHAFPGTIYSSSGDRSLYNYEVNIFLCGITVGYKVKA